MFGSLAYRLRFSSTSTSPRLFALWLLTMIAIPILLWVNGDEYLPWSVTTSVLMQAMLVASVLYQRLGSLSLLYILLTILPASWMLEVVGSSTGYPFGQYHYTDKLVPQIAHVPLIIPLSWLMMLPPAWVIAERICNKMSGVTFSLLSGAAMTAWDLYLDPQMVGWGFWQWEVQAMFNGGYFGIPWMNFFGWWLGGSLLTWCVTLVVELTPLSVKAIRRPASDSLWLIYVAVWLLEVGGLALFWGLPGPAFCGFLGMGSLIIWGMLTK